MQSLYFHSSASSASASASAPASAPAYETAADTITPADTATPADTPTPLIEDDFLSKVLMEPITAVARSLGKEIRLAGCGIFLILAALFIKSALIIAIAIIALVGAYGFFAYTHRGAQLLETAFAFLLARFLSSTGTDVRRVVVFVSWTKKLAREVPMTMLIVDILAAIVAFFIEPLPSVAVYTLSLSVLNIIVCPANLKKWGSYTLLLILVSWTLYQQTTLTTAVILIVIPVIGRTLLTIAVIQIAGKKNDILRTLVVSLLDVVVTRECGVSLAEITTDCKQKLISVLKVIEPIVPVLVSRIAVKFDIHEFSVNGLGITEKPDVYFPDSDDEMKPSSDKMKSDEDDCEETVPGENGPIKQSSIKVVVGALLDMWKNPTKSALYSNIKEFLAAPTSPTMKAVTDKLLRAATGGDSITKLNEMMAIVAPVQMNNRVLLVVFFLALAKKVVFPLFSLLTWKVKHKYLSALAVSICLTWLFNLVIKRKKAKNSTSFALFPSIGILCEKYALFDFLTTCFDYAKEVKGGLTVLWDLVYACMVKAGFEKYVQNWVPTQKQESEQKSQKSSLKVVCDTIKQVRAVRNAQVGLYKIRTAFTKLFELMKSDGISRCS